MTKTELLHQIETLYYQDKILQCSWLLQKIKEEYHLDNGDQDAGDTTLTPLNVKLLKTIELECAQVVAFKQALAQNDGWTLSYNGTDTKVWYRREIGASTHSIQLSGTIRAPLVNIAALLYESDLYHELFWYVTSSACIPVDHQSDFKRAAHITAFAPWPLCNRDVTLYSYAVDALDEEGEGGVIVISRSAREGDPVEQIPSPAARVVRADVHNSGFELRPVSPGVTTVRFLYNIDPCFNFLPMPVVNWAARTLCRWSLRMLEARARDLDVISPEYQRRVASSPVYDRIRTRLYEFWTTKGVPFDPIKGPGCGYLNSTESRPSETFDPNVKPQIPASLITSLITGDSAQPSAELPGLRKKLSARLFGSQSNQYNPSQGQEE